LCSACNSPYKVKWGRAVSGVRQYQETFSFNIALKPNETYWAASEVEIGGRAHVWLRDKYGAPVTSKKSKILKSVPRTTAVPIIVPGMPFAPVITLINMN